MGWISVTSNKGFLLKLEKPLPPSDVVKTMQIIPWLLKLEDGSTCEMMTGTKPMTEKGPINYGCTAKKVSNTCWEGLLEDSIKQGDVWTVEKVHYCSSNTSIVAVTKIETVKILKAWQ